MSPSKFQSNFSSNSKFIRVDGGVSADSNPINYVLVIHTQTRTRTHTHIYILKLLPKKELYVLRLNVRINQKSNNRWTRISIILIKVFFTRLVVSLGNQLPMIMRESQMYHLDGAHGIRARLIWHIQPSLPLRKPLCLVTPQSFQPTQIPLLPVMPTTPYFN